MKVNLMPGGDLSAVGYVYPGILLTGLYIVSQAEKTEQAILIT
jgi:hypothetical protein